MFVVGPAIGFITGGMLLQLPTDFDVSPSANLVSQESPLWVGAWWAGFVVAWVAAWVGAAALGMYPRALPGKEKHNKVGYTLYDVLYAIHIRFTSVLRTVQYKVRKSFMFCTAASHFVRVLSLFRSPKLMAFQV